MFKTVALLIVIKEQHEWRSLEFIHRETYFLYFHSPGGRTKL